MKDQVKSSIIKSKSLVIKLGHHEGSVWFQTTECWTIDQEDLISQRRAALEMDWVRIHMLPSLGKRKATEVKKQAGSDKYLLFHYIMGIFSLELSQDYPSSLLTSSQCSPVVSLPGTLSFSRGPFTLVGRWVSLNCYLTFSFPSLEIDNGYTV